MNIPAKSIIIQIKQNSYTVDFPNIGQLIDIESKKAAYSNDSYNAMEKLNTIPSAFALNCIDMVATFGTLIPQIEKDLNINNIFKLNPIEALDFIGPYKETYLPWFEQWMEILTKKEEPKKEESKKESK